MTFSSRTASALEAIGGSIATQAEQLQHVVLDHVAQRAGLRRSSRRALDADRLGDGDLDVVDVLRFQIGSKIELANRNARMFWTVSLPR